MDGPKGQGGLDKKLKIQVRKYHKNICPGFWLPKTLRENILPPPRLEKEAES